MERTVLGTWLMQDLKGKSLKSVPEINGEWISIKTCLELIRALLSPKGRRKIGILLLKVGLMETYMLARMLQLLEIQLLLNQETIKCSS
jgi:hypothetical protein